MACANSRILIWVNHLEVMPALVAFFKLNVNLLVRRDHIVLQVPPGASAELRDDDVAVAEEIDIEVDVGHGRARDVDLRDVRREVGYHLGHGGDLEGGADDYDKVYNVAIMLDQASAELVGQSLPKEGDIGFHNAGGWDIVVLIRAVIIVATTAPPGGGAVLGALPLSHAIAAQSGDALDASRDLAGLHVVKYGVAGDLVTTALAGGGGEGAMALDQLLLAYSGICLNIVDVLGIVS